MTKPASVASAERESAEQIEAYKKLEKISMEVELLKAGIPMPSGNIYPLDLLEKAIEELQEPIEKRQVLGQFDPVSHNPQVELGKATHLVTSLTLNEDGVLCATLNLLPTPKGLDLLKFIEAGGEVRAAPRGFGNVGEDHVITEYTILTVDLHPAYSDVVTESTFTEAKPKDE